MCGRRWAAATASRSRWRRPTKRIDWILVRGLEPVSAEVLKTDASDHLPVSGATFKLEIEPVSETGHDRCDASTPQWPADGRRAVPTDV